MDTESQHLHRGSGHVDNRLPDDVRLQGVMGLDLLGGPVGFRPGVYHLGTEPLQRRLQDGRPHSRPQGKRPRPALPVDDNANHLGHLLQCHHALRGHGLGLRHSRFAHAGAAVGIPQHHGTTTRPVHAGQRIFRAQAAAGRTQPAKTAELYTGNQQQHPYETEPPQQPRGEEKSEIRREDTGLLREALPPPQSLRQGVHGDGTLPFGLRLQPRHHLRPHSRGDIPSHLFPAMDRPQDGGQGDGSQRDVRTFHLPHPAAPAEGEDAHRPPAGRGRSHGR